MSVEAKLLKIHKLGLYTQFTPEQLESTYMLLINYLQFNIASISSIKYYDLLELHFYVSLLSNKDNEAKTALDRIIDKFGDQDSQRTAILKATYLEATMDSKTAIEYLSRRKQSELLSLKKKVALSKKITISNDYINVLIDYLKINPLDTEVLSELAETYYSIGHFDKAIFTLQEILLVVPFAYNVFARIGEIEHAIFKRDNEVDSLVSSIKHFLRSVELSANYVRSWSGIYITSNEFNKLEPKKLKNVKVEYEKLKKLSGKKLKEIINTKGTNSEDIKAAEKILSTF